MSELTPEKLARELEKQRAALEARPTELPEGGAEPPRGALPALFRALRDAGADARAATWPALGARLPDGPLLEPTLALAREAGEEAALVAAWLPNAGAGAWCAHQQVAALHAATGGDPRRTVELVGSLTQDAWDPTDLALAAGLEGTLRGLREAIKLRLASPARRRDRTSARLARGAVLALAKLAPGEGEVAATFAQVVAAETRRAGKDEPELALAALEALGTAPPFERLRLLAPLGRGIERAKVATRIEDALAAAAAEVGAGPEDRTDLLARTGGLEADGWVRVPLDDGGEAKLRIAADGTLEQTVALEPGGPPGAVTPLGAGPRLGSADARSIEAAARELTQARGDLARRLELALVTGRGWPVSLWRATFASGHPLWADLAPRVLWELRGPSGATAFELGPTLEGVLGDAVDLPDGATVGLAHPARLEREELELWRERALERVVKGDPAERRRPEPFPQRFRAIGPDEPLEATTARFVGRQAHKQAVGEMARRSGWAGFPLLGTGPWDLTRALPGGARARLTVEDAPLEVSKLPPARRPSLTGERELDEDAAFGPSRDPKHKGKRPPPEAAPRVRLAALELSAGADAVARAELRLDLETLTDGLATVDELWLRVWQQRKWKDEKESWREAVLRYRVASGAPVDVRKAVLAALAKARGLSARLEDRFAIVGQYVVELGTGLVHQGATKEHLPQWKVDELLAKSASPPPALPFEPAADPASAEVIARVLGLAAL